MREAIRHPFSATYPSAPCPPPRSSGSTARGPSLACADCSLTLLIDDLHIRWTYHYWVDCVIQDEALSRENEASEIVQVDFVVVKRRGAAERFQNVLHSKQRTWVSVIVCKAGVCYFTDLVVF